MARNLVLRKVLPSLLFMAYGVGAQQPGDLLTKLRKLQLVEKPGAVLLLYSPSAEQRATGYQKSLQAAHAWYERQLRIQVPLKCLAVLDREAWEKYSPGSPYPFLPGAVPAQRVITVSADMDKLPGERPADLPLEAAIFHEDGHILAHTLNIAGGSFTGEFFANLFSAAYILSERPYLKSVLDGPSAEEWPTPPRYTSLADINYFLMTPANYVWFQYHLERIAGLFMKDQNLADIVRKLQSEFPAGSLAASRGATPVTPLEDIYSRFEKIRPGFRKMLGPLGAPGTIPRMMPSTCPAALVKAGTLIVQNDSADALTVTSSAGEVREIPGHHWTKFSGTVKLQNGSCLVPRDEPGLAILQKP